MGLGYVVTGILYRGLCPDALNDPIHSLTHSLTHSDSPDDIVHYGLARKQKNYTTETMTL